MILLCSGGIDSIITLRLQECEAVYFKLGTRAQEHELCVVDWAQRIFGAKIEVGDDLDRLGSHEFDNGYLPYRNGLMVTFAAMRDPDVMVAQVAEWAPDKSRRYWRVLEKQLTMAGKGATQGIDTRVRIHTPYAHLTKGQLLKMYADEFGFDETRLLLQATWSCYGDGANHCGRCSGCVQRKVAEKAAGVQATIFSDRYFLPEFQARPMIRDACRWVRDNRSVGGLVRRVVEQWNYEDSR